MKRIKSSEYWSNVSYHYTKEDGTAGVDVLRVKYPRMTEPEIKEVKAKADAGGLQDDEFLSIYIKDWDGPTEDDGAPIKWVDQPARDAFLDDMPGLRAVIIRGFFRSQPGATREKNS